MQLISCITSKCSHSVTDKAIKATPISAFFIKLSEPTSKSKKIDAVFIVFQYAVRRQREAMIYGKHFMPRQSVQIGSSF